MTDCRCLLIVIALLMAVVYAVCIVATKHAFQNAGTGETQNCQQPTESGQFLIELISTKASRFTRSGPVFKELKVVELYELQKKNSEQVFNMKIHLKIQWIDDYRVQTSKAFRSLELLIVTGIEDLFDRKFYDQNKSISVHVVEMKRVKKSGGVMIKTKATGLDGKIEIEELKMAIEEGAGALYKEITQKLASGVFEASGSAETVNSVEVLS